MSKRKKSRRQFTIEKKAAILREHLADKVPVSELCDKHRLQPSVFYAWQRQLLDYAEAALTAGSGRNRGKSREDELLKELEAQRLKLAKKDNVIAEISEEFVALKKELGAP